jgi:hypothetical protein
MLFAHQAEDLKAQKFSFRPPKAYMKSLILPSVAGAQNAPLTLGSALRALRPEGSTLFLIIYHI